MFVTALEALLVTLGAFKPAAGAGAGAEASVDDVEVPDDAPAGPVAYRYHAPPRRRPQDRGGWDDSGSSTEDDNDEDEGAQHGLRTGPGGGGRPGPGAVEAV
jgi:hypothetical protein